MKIGVDISDLSSDRADGTTRYTFELALRLPQIGRQYEWFYFAPSDSARIQSAVAARENVNLRVSPWPKYWTQLRLPLELYQDQLDALFMPIHQSPYLRPGKMKTVAVIHDLAVHLFPAQFTRKDWLLLHVFSAQAARQADALVCVSQATADDVQRFYGRRRNVHVVYHGVDHKRFRVPRDEERTAARTRLVDKYPQLAAPYILFVGQLQPRKNIARLVKAFELMASTEGDLKLVIAGGHGWMQQPILRRVASSPERARIHLIGRVADDQLPALYWGAEVFVLPSLYEGFGMPLLEASASGCPVVVSNVSSLPEVARLHQGCGGQANYAAVLVDPYRAEDIARGIQEALGQRAVWRERGVQRAAQFSWDTTARETLRIIESTCL